MIKKIFSMLAAVAIVITPFAFSMPAQAVITPGFDVTGDYVLDMEYLGSPYTHDASLVQDESGDLTGDGGSPSGANVYTWEITSGTVVGSAIDFMADYTATPDAVTPQTTLHVMGVIAEDGTMSGTWSDNYNGGAREGTFTTVSGAASPLGVLAAEDFGVVDYDTGMGMLKGYSAGFGLSDAVFTDATSVIVKLYSAGDVLLQTNTFDIANVPLITGNQISVPFDVSGSFDYATDGYWTNDQEAEYGQSVPATKVIATVTLSNGQVLVAENTNLTGDPATIYPEMSGNITTDPATNITASNATLNGTNGDNAANGHSFWASLSSFSTDSPTLPSGVYSTSDLGAIAANTPFSAQLSSVSGLPAITDDTTYYFAAWSSVEGTWYPGAVLHFTTSDGTIGGDVEGEGVLHVDSVDVVDSTATANGTFASGWEYVFHITIPTDEPDLAMKFSDWAKTGGGGTIATANNMRISSAQANNSGATVLITAADTYSTPDLHMVTDLDSGTPGIQVEVTVEVAIPVSTPSGAYTTSYGVLTN
jgi:hypothetical protein